MLRNETDSQGDNYLSLCSSCKSELQCIFSLGIPSYLETSVSSSTSSIPDTQELSGTANDAIKTIHSVPTLKRHVNKDERASLYLPSEESERMKRARKDNLQFQVLSSKRFADRSNAEERTQNDTYNFINLRKKGVGILDDPRDASCADEDWSNIDRTVNVTEVESFDQSRKATFCNQTTIASRELAGSQHAIKRESVDVDLAHRRRNVYELATRVLKFSANVQEVRKVLLRMRYQNRPETRRDREVIFVNEAGDIDDTNDANRKDTLSAQDMPMYNYNPLRAKENGKLNVRNSHARCSLADL